MTFKLSCDVGKSKVQFGNFRTINEIRSPSWFYEHLGNILYLGTYCLKKIGNSSLVLTYFYKKILYYFIFINRKVIFASSMVFMAVLLY